MPESFEEGGLRGIVDHGARFPQVNSRSVGYAPLLSLPILSAE